MELSIIIPVWNEARKIKYDIINLSQFLESFKITADIIVVDDGSTDGTAQVVESIQSSVPENIQCIRYSPHRGKGYAVRKGVEAAQGEYIMFMDSGGTVPLKYINTGLQLLKDNKCNIAIGSRHNPDSKIERNFIWYRQVTSSLFRLVVRRFLKIPNHINDTQCGLKLYKNDIAKEIFAQCKNDGFLFDLECILIAQSKGYRQQQFPIKWICDRDSRLSIVKNSVSVYNELRELRKRFTV